MDNFRKPKARRGRGPIDGIIRPSNLRKNSGSLSFRSSSQRGAQPARLDDFRRPDGFIPSAPATMAAPMSDRPRRPVTPGMTPMPSPKLKHKREHRVRRYALRGALTLFMAIILTGGFIVGKAYWK